MYPTHRIIQGGEQWLPFAESKLAALRLLGTQYAVQRFIMADGAEVTIRIVGEQQIIRITGGTCVLPMDSGVVDVLNIAEANPGTFKGGVMHAPTAVAAYNASFVLPEGGGDWLLNPSTDSNTQVSGILTTAKSGRMRGKLPKDKTFAASFTPKPVLDTTVAPAVWKATEHDETLWAKKILAIICPPSIFTGKTRLYVQALYGRHLYNRADSNVSQDPVNIGLVAGNPPYIVLPSYKAPGDQATYESVRVYTSSGVHLDRSTGKHYLLTVGGHTVDMHPLVGDACAEGLRKFLKLPYLSDLPVLDAATLEHLEAYILSRCLPDQKNVKVLNAILPLTFYSMGYSWHWNWSGTVADVVTNEQFAQIPGGDKFYAMRSSHYRLELSKAGEAWAVNRSTIEENVVWAIDRQFYVIAEPDNARGVLLKTNPHYSNLFGCNAPFYAFYTRDELQLCRVSSSLVPSQPDTIDFTENYYDDAAHEVRYVTAGDHSGYLREKSYGSPYFAVEFTCGTSSTGVMTTGRSARTSANEMSRVIVDQRVGPTFSNEDGLYTGQFSYGYQPYSTSPYFKDVIRNVSFFVSGISTVEVLDIREEWVGVGAAVVPFRDAEAIYLRSSQLKYTYKVGYSTVWQDDRYPGYGITTRVSFPYTGGADLWFTIFPPLPAGPPVGNSPVVSPVDETVIAPELDKKVLRCIGGEVPLDVWDGMGDLLNQEVEEVAGNFSVLSGTSTANPVVIADKKTNPVGVEPAGFAPVLVGWI